MTNELKEIGLAHYLQKVKSYNDYFVEEASRAGDDTHAMASVVRVVIRMAADAMAIASEFDLDLDDPEIEHRLLDPDLGED